MSHTTTRGPGRGGPLRELTPEECQRWMTFCLFPREVTGRVLQRGDVSPDPGHRPGSTQRSRPSGTGPEHR